MEDVLVDGGYGWSLEGSKSIRREDRERLGPRRRVVCFYFCVFFLGSLFFLFYLNDIFVFNKLTFLAYIF